MYEQDYLLRQIKEMISVIMKMLFGAELRSAEQTAADQQRSDEESGLLRMIDRGQITEAERMFYARMDAKTAANLLMGYSFYQYLAQKDDDFLEQHGYSREMLINGIRRLAALFDAGHLAALFLPD